MSNSLLFNNAMLSSRKHFHSRYSIQSFRMLITTSGGNDILTMTLDPQKLRLFIQTLRFLHGKRLNLFAHPEHYQILKIYELPYHSTLSALDYPNKELFPPNNLSLFSQVNQSLINYSRHDQFRFNDNDNDQNYFNFQNFFNRLDNFLGLEDYFRKTFTGTRLIPFSSHYYYDTAAPKSVMFMISPGDTAQFHQHAWAQKHLAKTLPRRSSAIRSLDHVKIIEHGEDHVSYGIASGLPAYIFSALLDSTHRIVFHSQEENGSNHSTFRILSRPTLISFKNRKLYKNLLPTAIALTPTNYLHLATESAASDFLTFLNTAFPFSFEFTPVEEVFPESLHPMDATLPSANIKFI